MKHPAAEIIMSSDLLAQCAVNQHNNGLWWRRLGCQCWCWSVFTLLWIFLDFFI